MSSPLISIVMPVWNAASYLREALDSILQQTFRDFELVAVDDGSTDDSVAIINSYNDPRIRLIEQGRKGFVTAVNRGVAEAKSDWIARHDADDLSHPNRLQAQWNLIQAKPDAILAYCGTESFGSNVETHGTRRFPKSNALIALRSCFINPVCVGAALIRKDLFLNSSGYREEDFPAEDFAFASRLLRMGGFVGTQQILYRIRTHEGQISQVRRDAQIKQSKRVALENCAYFFKTTPHQAETLNSILLGQKGYRKFRHSLKLLGALTRFRMQSFEIWMWAFRRLLKSFRN
jgi:glycosyltransferase involved in cell wall biosynthesis